MVRAGKSFGTGCPGWKSPNAKHTMATAMIPSPYMRQPKVESIFCAVMFPVLKRGQSIFLKRNHLPRLFRARKIHLGRERPTNRRGGFLDCGCGLQHRRPYCFPFFYQHAGFN
jgi:hypothetical protein